MHKFHAAYTILTVLFDNRFFMIDRTRNGDELREEFDILGSTGNVSMSFYLDFNIGFVLTAS